MDFLFQKMKGKKKDVLNRIFVERGHTMVVTWNCDVCNSVFGTFRQLKAHKIDIHTH
jgi:hypothetical protein